MDLNDLTKAQKHYALCALVAVVVLFGGGGLVGKLNSSIDESRLALDDVNGKIERAEKSMRLSSTMNTQLKESMAVLKTRIAQTPPDKNNYSWATELIYPLGRQVRFEVDAISELNMASTRSFAKPESEGDVVVGSYSLRVTGQGSYASVVGFIDHLEQGHPFVRVTGVELRASGTPEKHQVQLFLQWPSQLQSVASSWSEVEL